MVEQSRRVPSAAETDAARDRGYRIDRSGRLLTKNDKSIATRGTV